jgi:hypothetical protein
MAYLKTGVQYWAEHVNLKRGSNRNNEKNIRENPYTVLLTKSINCIIYKIDKCTLQKKKSIHFTLQKIHKLYFHKIHKLKSSQNQ